VASLTRTSALGVIGTAIALTVGLSTTSSAQIIVPGYPYGYRYAAPDASVKFDVKPKDAAVYVDGYYAGLVDDYDGAFQRLRTAPGGHEITLFLEGYRTYTERVYLSADNTVKLQHRMEKLAGGEASARPPAPQSPQYQTGQPEDGQQPLPRGPVGRRGGPRTFPPGPPDNFPPQPPGPGERPDTNTTRGTLALTVQPGDAEVLVDGTPWRDGGDRLTIDLSEGRHNIQIRKPGFVGYLTDVQIRRGETTNLDVQLKTQPR
jgi:hypothetical protein